MPTEYLESDQENQRRARTHKHVLEHLYQLHRIYGN